MKFFAILLVRNKEANDIIIRPQYMNKLKTYRDVPLVKILAGIRRCGKSTILDMLRDDLLKSGIAADHIISMRYTSEDFDDGMTDKDMYRSIKEQMTDDGRYYLLLDEVQEISGWAVSLLWRWEILMNVLPIRLWRAFITRLLPMTLQSGTIS